MAQMDKKRPGCRNFSDGRAAARVEMVKNSGQEMASRGRVTALAVCRVAPGAK